MRNTLERTDQELNNHLIKMDGVRENLSIQLKDAKLNAGMLLKL